MADPDIRGIEVDRLIRSAIDGDSDDAETLILDPWFQGLLEEISRWVRRNYKKDPNDVTQNLVLTLLKAIHTLKNPRRCTLRSWLYMVARNSLLNDITRSDERFIQYDEESYAENLSDTTTPPTASINPALLSVPPTQEQEFSEKEIQTVFLRVTKSSPLKRKIFKLWWEGNNSTEIAKKVGRSPKTVAPLLKEIQRAVVSEVGLRPLETQEIIVNPILADRPHLTVYKRAI
jgi:RNA polymerase sigma factor (sigma-70 family)